MSKAILLAEDSSDDVFFFKRVLDSAGVFNPVHVVTNGDEAITYLKGESPYADRERYPEPCILFLDLRMPRADGWCVLDWLAKRSPQKNLLVIVLSDEDRFSHLQQAYSMGAHTFILKPLQTAELKGLIKYWPNHWVLGNPPGKSSGTPFAA